jgi:hypothetical protein
VLNYQGNEETMNDPSRLVSLLLRLPSMFSVNKNKRTMLRVVCALGLTITMIGFPIQATNAVRGVISHRISGCDYFIVATKSGYDLLEWYGGHDPAKDDILIGSYEAYGFHDVYDETADESIHVWTEDYQLTKTDALEKLADKCE